MKLWRTHWLCYDRCGGDLCMESVFEILRTVFIVMGIIGAIESIVLGIYFIRFILDVGAADLHEPGIYLHAPYM